MGKRPGRIYRSARRRSYTRKEYISKGISDPKITMYDMGDLSTNFELELSLIAKEEGQITHNALEAARVASNKYMHKKTGRKGYHLKIRVFPHQVLRENKMAVGAGADRVQDGMRKAFGKPISLAARVKKGQKIITVGTTAANYAFAKDALKRAASKFSMPYRITIDQGKEILRL